MENMEQTQYTTDENGLVKSAEKRQEGLTGFITKLATEWRASATLDQLVYGLHQARERLDNIRNPEVARFYTGTPLWKLAHNAPLEYEQAIRIRNARLCYEARLEMYKNAGLVE